MDLQLQNNTPIAEIKERFHRKFPFLKLEFFYPTNNEAERYTRRNMMMDGLKRLGEISELFRPGNISINEFQSVEMLEDHFREYFGVYVQVFRKSGETWIITTNTDTLTLAEQNRKGEEHHAPFQEEQTEDDYHEQL